LLLSPGEGIRSSGCQPRRAIRSRGRALLVAGMAGLTLVACGADAGERSLTASEQTHLRSLLTDVRSAKRDGDPQRARDALREFRAKVRALAREGALSEPEAAALRAGAKRAEARVAAEVAPPPKVPDPPPAPREGDDEGEDEDEDEDEGKGKGDDHE